jgi:hypothetical protein
MVRNIRHGIGLSLLILQFVCMFEISAFSQSVSPYIPEIFDNTHKRLVGDFPPILPTNQLKKTRSVPFWTDNFGAVTGSGSSILPIGWTALSIVGNGTWRWTNTASSGGFGIGALASPSNANGWMIYDSDSIANISGLVNGGPAGELISPMINCSAHPYIKCSFYESFRKFQDSCFLMVSPDSGITWTKFQIPDRAFMAANNGNANPTYQSINISSVAGGSSKVLIRFSYKCSSNLGAYNWLVDDVALSDLDSTDMGVFELGHFFEQGVGSNTVASTFNGIPASLNTPFVVNFKYLNHGSNTINSQNIDAKSVRVANGSIFNSQTFSFGNLMANTPIQNGFLGSTILAPQGNCYTHLNAALGGDVNPSDNVDTIFYGVTDTTYNQFGRFLSGTFVLNRPIGVLPAVKQIGGTLFVIPDGKVDTLTSVRVYISNSTTVGSKMTVEIYKITGGVALGSSYHLIAQSDTTTLTAANISTSTLLRSVVIPIPFKNAPQTPILTPGRYLVCLRAVGESSQNVTVITTDMPNNNILLSIADDNNGQYMGQAPFNPYTLTAAVPMIELGFAKNTDTSKALIYLSNKDISSNFSIYPNPVTSSLTVELPEGTDGKITVTDVLGTVQMTKNIVGTTTFNVENLATGTYFLNMLDAKGGTSSKSFIKK